MKGHKEEEQALKLTRAGGSSGWGRGRTSGKGGHSRGKPFNNELIECFNYNKLRHFQYECPSLEEKAKYTEFDEDKELLLMAITIDESNSKNVWFLDAGCSNHMYGHK